MRSLVGLVLFLVLGVVVLLGAGVVAWITADDLARSRADAHLQQDAAEGQLRGLAHDLAAEAQASARALVRGSDRRLRMWIAEEPLELYRDPIPPHPIDPEALRNGLGAEVRSRSLAESAHADVVARAMEAEAAERIERGAEVQRREAAARAEAASSARRDALVRRLALLLAGMAVLLAVTLYVLVLAPVRRLRGAVDRIASGDLRTPVAQRRWPTREMSALALDVERMREQIREATEDLEAQVARKTETLERTLAERTAALEDLRTTQDRLIQVEKMAGLGTLAGGVAHEFNNLLGGILGCLQSARAGTQDDAVREDLDVAKRTARRAADLVEALLGVTRPGSGTFEGVDLRRVVEDVLRTAEVTARQRRVTFRADLRGAPVVHGHEGQLHQVVLNLVTNALQAVDDGERVEVSLAADGRHAKLEVRDTGPGVAPEERRRIFEPFFTGRAGGTGLGLFLSFGIVERHGGRIEVADADGGGACFTVRIPLSGDTSAAVP